MIYEFENLTQAEKDMMLKAPALIAVMIAGADNRIEPQELKRAIELVNIKTFSEKQDIQPFYHEVEKTINQDIDAVVAALPGGADERNAVISDELAKLNGVFPRLKSKFARDLYTSLKHYAHMVAQSWGGILGIASVSAQEKKWVNLPMINEPGLTEE